MNKEIRKFLKEKKFVIGVPTVVRLNTEKVQSNSMQQFSYGC